MQLLKIMKPIQKKLKELFLHLREVQPLVVVPLVQDTLKKLLQLKNKGGETVA
jgi:hypothetical protein